MAKSLIVTGSTSSTNDNLTRYFPLGTVFNTAGTTEAAVELPIRDAGVFSNLFINVGTNTITANSTFTIRKSQTDTLMEITYAADETGIKEDTTNPTAYASTDELSVRIVTQDEAAVTSNIVTRIVSIQFEPDDQTKTVTYLGCVGNSSFSTDSTTTYVPPMGFNILSTTEGSASVQFKKEFTTEDFFVYVTSNTRSTDTTYNVRINNANGNQSLTFSAAETGAKEDSSNTDTIAVDDIFNYSLVTGTGGGSIAQFKLSNTYISSPSTFILGGMNINGVGFNFNLTRYFGGGGPSAAIATEAQVNMTAHFHFTAYLLTAFCQTNTIATNATTMTFRVNNGPGNQTLTYNTGETGLKTDTTNTDVVSDGDEVDFEVVTPNTSGTFTLRYFKTYCLSDVEIDLTDPVVVPATALKNPQRSISESAIATDLSTKETRRTATESMTVVDFFEYVLETLLNYVFEEAIVVRDTVTKTIETIKSEIVTATDAIERVINRTIEFSLGVIDSIAKSLERTVNEVVNVVDSVIKTIATVKNEVIQISDSLIRSVSRTISESVVLIDTGIRSISRALTDTLQGVDSVIKSIGRTLSEALAITDVFSQIKATVLELVESIVTNDTIVRTIQTVKSEVISATDTVLKRTSRLIEEVVGVYDTLERAIGKVITESITAIDSLIRAITRQIGEAVVVIDTNIKSIARNINENIVLEDVLTALKVILYEITETIKAIDSVTRSIARTIDENVSLNDVFAKASLFYRTLNEVISVTDIFAYISGISQTIGTFVLHSVYGLMYSINQFARSIKLFQNKRSKELQLGNRELTLYEKGRNKTLQK